MTPWTIARQVPLSVGYSRQEYWSGLPFPSPGDFPNPGIEPRSPALQADSLPSEPRVKPVLEYRKLNAVSSEVLVSQLCSALCPMDCSPLGSSVHGILQARILKWVAIPFSRGFSQPRDRTQASLIAGRFFTGWAPREVKFYIIISCILKHVIVYIITSSLFRNLRWFFFPI